LLAGQIGQVAIRILFIVILGSLAVHLTAIVKRTSFWRMLSRYAMAVQLLFGLISSVALVYLLITENLWYPYVAEYTGQGLSLIYRIAAFWGGNAGSLLLWTLILGLYGTVSAFSKHEDSSRMLPIVSTILTVVSLFYTSIVNFAADPFTRSAHPAVAGNGLNPLLQNPGMTVHPVNVYLGYVGFTVPFAYAMAGLLLKKTDATWVRVTRRWTLISWLFLSIGIVYGAHWSYEELGWGGYWAWDPVENASLLPWLTATAFLHSAIVQEKKGMLKGWNVILVTLTFLLTILGTFLTRSGVLWSIHAFANGPMGTYFLMLLIVFTVISCALIVWRWPTLKAERKFDAVVSKESGFMLNNILFLASTFAVLWGTIFPLVSEGLTGNTLMVSAPFYNEVNLPLAVCIMLLMGVGPVIAWRRSTMKSIVFVVFVPLLVSVGLGLAVAGWLHVMFHHASLLSTLALIGAIFVIITVVLEFVRSVQARVLLTKEPWWLSLGRLLSKNRRRYGGYIVHFAIAIMAIGIAGSGAYHVDLQQQLAPGQRATIGSYQVEFLGMGVKNQPGGKEMYADLAVAERGHAIGVLQPAATFYTNGQEPSTDIALYSRPLQDLYVVMLGTASQNQAVFDLHINPLIQLIWYGGYLFILGTLVSLWPTAFRKPERAGIGYETELDEAVYLDLAELEYDFKMGKLDEETYQVSRNELMAGARQLEADRARLRQAILAELNTDATNGGGQL
jgi:cytochrome c-type biogenesis protein CcmF